MLNGTKEGISHLNIQIFEKQEISNFHFSCNSLSVIVSDGEKVPSDKIALLSVNVWWLTLVSRLVLYLCFCSCLYYLIKKGCLKDLIFSSFFLTKNVCEYQNELFFF